MVGQRRWFATGRSRVLTLVAALLTSLGLTMAVSTPAYAWSVDNVKITDQGIDFGGSVWAFGAPVGSGNLRWEVGPPDYSIVTPALEGTLHLNNVAQECGRMHMGVYDTNGNLLGITHGGSVCASDNSHHSWHVDLHSTVSGPTVEEVTICTEMQNNSGGWDIIGCQTEYKS